MTENTLASEFDTAYTKKKVKIPFEWEVTKEQGWGAVARAKVYGGWIVNSLTESPSKQASESMVFVPDPNHQWEV